MIFSWDLLFIIKLIKKINVLKFYEYNKMAILSLKAKFT
jgi:hypothetical protein